MALRLMFHPERAREVLTIVKDNDNFFMTTTINKLDEQVNELTKHSDNVTYVDEMFYEDVEGYRHPWYTLSVGCKTILNVFYNPTICFDQVECTANNCADLKNLKQGCITPGFIIDLDGDDTCDVIVDDDESKMYTSVKGIHCGSGLSYRNGIIQLNLAYGFNIITDMTSRDREMLLQGVKCYDNAPIIEHIATKAEYRKFLNLVPSHEHKNTVFFLDRFALFGNQEILGKCRDFKESAMLLECSGFVDKTYILPRADVKVERSGRNLSIIQK